MPSHQHPQALAKNDHISPNRLRCLSPVSTGVGQEYHIGPHICVPFPRHPQALAKEAADLAEAKKRQQMAQMGEDRGVARNAAVALESNTARVGRKCDSASCLAREGLGGAAFKRCGACK